MTDETQELKKLRRAARVVPRNRLKEKVGEGGFDKAALVKAEALLKENKIDFEPTAMALVQLLDKTLADAKSGATAGEVAIDAILYPIMQLKSQGSMFQYPFLTFISDILINFLETVATIDKDVLDIVAVHKTALYVVLSDKIMDADSKTGKDLCDSLLASCQRYYRSRGMME